MTHSAPAGHLRRRRPVCGSCEWALKGGYAMELRMAGARATRDIDLALRHHMRAKGESLNFRMLEMLQTAAAADVETHTTFAPSSLIPLQRGQCRLRSWPEGAGFRPLSPPQAFPWRCEDQSTPLRCPE